MEWSKEFKAFLESPLGVEMIRSLREDLHGSLITSAQDAESIEKGYGLLKEAAGVIKVLDHLQMRAH